MAKITVSVETDERWPDYLLADPAGDDQSFEVDAETLARWRAAIADYEVVQKEMEAAKNAAWQQWKAARGHI